VRGRPGRDDEAVRDATKKMWSTVQGAGEGAEFAAPAGDDRAPNGRGSLRCASEILPDDSREEQAEQERTRQMPPSPEHNNQGAAQESQSRLVTPSQIVRSSGR